jgi:methionyl-tRNA formyltransferase
MIRVAFFGGAAVGLGFLRELYAAHQRGRCDLIGACPAHKSENSNPLVAPFLANHNVPALEAVPDCDLIFSAGNNNYIFNAEEIAKAKRGIINFHAAPLPEYAGSAAPAFAILNQESEFGVTFHYVIPKLDAGDILHTERFPIDASWTAKELDDQCAKVGLEAFTRLVDPIH